MKHILVSSQTWYLPELCESCDEFHRMEATSAEDLRMNATVAWCGLIEQEKPCKKRRDVNEC